MECIRGLAILLVFLFHVYGISSGGQGNPPSFLMSFVVSGNTGVTLFFVLSGFLLSRPWLIALRDGPGLMPGIKNYYIARILRVLPLYYVFVLFAALMTGNWPAAAEAFAFSYVGFEIFPYSVIWWTLSTEVQFYLLLPLAFYGWAMGKWLRLLLGAGLLLWLYCYLRFVILDNPAIAGNFFLSKSLFARLPAFLLGIGACWVYLRCEHWRPAAADSPRARVGALALALTTLMLLGLVLQSAALMTDRVAELNWHIHHSLEAALWTALLLILLLGKPLGAAALLNRPMAIAGKLSYSIYLNHVPILFFLIYPVRESLGQAQYLDSAWVYAIPLAALLASTLLAYVTYRLIEMPFLNIKHRLPVLAAKQ